jgi:hypothetical protein
MDALQMRSGVTVRSFAIVPVLTVRLDVEVIQLANYLGRPVLVEQVELVADVHFLKHGPLLYLRRSTATAKELFAQPVNRLPGFQPWYLAASIRLAFASSSFSLTGRAIPR